MSQLTAMEKIEVFRPISITLNGPNYIHWAQVCSSFSKSVESRELSLERLLLLFERNEKPNNIINERKTGTTKMVI